MTKFSATVKSALRPALKTAWWMIRLTVIISFAVTILQYFGIIDKVAVVAKPLFNMMGLPGEAALVFITGYFVNIYSAIAVMTTLEINLRAVTILAVMCLCAHNMVLETAVQKKTGSAAWRMVLVRTGYAVICAFVLNWLLPENNTLLAREAASAQVSFSETMRIWAVSSGKLILKMTILIVLLNILQRILSEYGIITKISKHLKPVMRVFGLPERTSFLWIVANILGLSYGAAVMIEETQRGEITREDADLLNHHIGIAHSNLEDMLLFFFAGASIPWMLGIRWFFAGVAVWTRRLFYLSPRNGTFMRLTKRNDFAKKRTFL